MDSKTALSPGDLVLVTGANGYLASHVASELLSAGYRVRGTVRDVGKNRWLQDHFDNAYGHNKFELFEVPDMVAVNAFHSAANGVAAIAHVASVMSNEADPNKVIPPVVAGVTNALEAAASQPSVKSFVYTSSSAAATSPGPGAAGHDVHEDSWNEGAIERAWAPGADHIVVYYASKAQAEQALWKWVGEWHPRFRVNAVLPNANFGRVISPEHQGYPSTAGWIEAIFKGTATDRLMRAISPQYFVDVQDTARLHVAALTRPDLSSQRLFAFAQPYTTNQILQTLRKLYPERQFPEDIPGLEEDNNKILPADNAERILKETGRSGWTSLEDSLRMNTEELAR
ncbi:hypothetical protein SLS55_010221 [Diplodia seriata]|uniref:NAD-dependent epimerase/dehydratase domain-containing protein n=1 Tax=Diplodia seriata TaxID=420778 RepID=A0ABR3BYM2_9PEZI